MGKYENIVLLDEETEIRTAINLKDRELYYSIIDVLYLVNDYEIRKLARDYWYSTKHRLKDRPFVSNYCDCVKVNVMSLDGKRHPSDFMDFDHIFKIIEYVSYSKLIGYGGVYWSRIIPEETLKVDREYYFELVHKYSNLPRQDFDEMKSTA